MRRDIAEIKREYSRKTREEAARNYINNTLVNMSDKDKDLLKVLHSFDDASGGRLDNFYQLYRTIKSNPPSEN